jgi:hypothetical protein
VALIGCSHRREVEMPEPDPHLADIERCASALRGIRGAMAEDRATLLAEGCADLFGQPICREAIRLSPLAAPDLRAPMIAAGCQNAYCGLFPNPEPELCGLNMATATPSEISAVWPSFMNEVLPLEILGVADDDSEELARQLGPLFVLVLFESATVVTPDIPAAPRRRMTVQLSMVESEFRLSAEREGEAFGPWDLPLRPDAGDFEGLLEAALRGCDDCDAFLQIDPEVEYDLVIVLMDVLEEAGLEIILLAPE